MSEGGENIANLWTEVNWSREERKESTEERKEKMIE
jgi:hypothetical protein